MIVLPPLLARVPREHPTRSQGLTDPRSGKRRGELRPVRAEFGTPTQLARCSAGRRLRKAHQPPRRPIQSMCLSLFRQESRRLGKASGLLCPISGDKPCNCVVPRGGRLSGSGTVAPANRRSCCGCWFCTSRGNIVRLGFRQLRRLAGHRPAPILHPI